MKNEVNEVEHIKAKSKHLRGTIAEELLNDSDGFSEESKSLIKFHGMYQQKTRDRSIPDEEKTFSLMIRGRIPGGRLTRDQYLVWDTLAETYAGNALRLTTRQSIQLHGILKKNIKKVIRAICDSLLSTIGACGDIVRNVTQPPNPRGEEHLFQLDKVAELLSNHFKSAANSYSEIWLDGKRVDPSTEKEEIYGDVYLPRKFKIGVTVAGNNSVDIYTNDLGVAATFGNDGKIDGYFVFAGGGLGTTHNKPETFARCADLLGWIPGADLIKTAEGIVTAFRDLGDRTNRRHARLKYVLAERGVEFFRSEVEKRSQIRFTDKPLPEWNTPSYQGWHKSSKEVWAFGLSIPSGRVSDLPGKPYKSDVRDIVKKYKVNIQVTPDQDLILYGFTEDDKQEAQVILNKYILPENSLEEKGLSCPALPTCGLALTEAERRFPEVLTAIKTVLDDLSIKTKMPIVRMTGCPNGCARPYSAEIGLVGQQAGGKYALYLGGNPEGTRVGFRAAEKISEVEIGNRLTPLFRKWKKEGESNSFGDFMHELGEAQVKELLL